MKRTVLRSLAGLFVLSSASVPVQMPAKSAQAPRVRPYVVGERSTFEVKLGLLFSMNVGSATLEVLNVDTVRGRAAYQTMLSIHGGAITYDLDDSINSWVDTLTLNSLRRHQNTIENEKPRVRTYEIFPDRQKWVGSDRVEHPSVGNPLDDVAFLFHARSLPLADGDTLSMPRYFRPESNPIGLAVLRRERIEAPWGKVNAVVVRPMVRTAKLFSEKAKTEMWLTDDAERIIIQIKARLAVGSVTLKLKSYRPAAGAAVRK